MDNTHNVGGAVTFSPNIDRCLRFFSIWLAATMAGTLGISLMSPIPKYLVLALASIPSVSVAWVLTREAVSLSKRTPREWVRYAVSTRVIMTVSTTIVLLSSWGIVELL